MRQAFLLIKDNSSQVAIFAKYQNDNISTYIRKLWKPGISLRIPNKPDSFADSSEAKNIRQVIIYLLVGGGTALFELLLFQCLYAFFGIPSGIANVIAVLAATATNFLLNGTVTFRQSSNLLRSIVLYTALFCFNTTFSTITIILCEGLGGPVLIAKLCTMVCIVCWNFVLYKKVVFV